MAQKFTSLDDAAKQLGISKDRLTQLREAAVIRAYRDGTSWKFRSDDIDKLVAEGIPQLDPGASDLSLNLDDDEPSAAPAAAPSDLDLAPADDELDASAAASDINLEDVDEPTVPATADDEGSDALAIDLDSDAIDLSDSILLSEMELGTPSDRPPSTIIGKAELDPDLDLAAAASGMEEKKKPAPAKKKPDSDILPAADDIALDLPSPSDDFAGLEELEVDLEAESSRILAPEDLTKAKAAAVAKAAADIKAATSDLELAPTDSDAGIMTSDIGLGGESAKGGAALTGLSALELDDDDDDQVLGEGSDVTLSGESSGINIISPSDSGLALDEVALDLSGSAPMGSSLDLGDVGDDVRLEPLELSEDAAASGEGFQLTPLGEDAGDDEKDSSQVIALDDVTEEGTAGVLGGGADAGMLGGDFEPVGLAGGVVAQPVVDMPFSVWNVLGLSACLLLMTICGMMAYDLLRNMWSWNEVTSLNSSLLEVLNWFL